MALSGEREAPSLIPVGNAVALVDGDAPAIDEVVDATTEARGRDVGIDQDVAREIG
jgi:hypothetical protein